MGVFLETSNGGSTVSGCALITYCKVYITAFGPGDIVYNINKAKRGIIEKIVIKNQKIINKSKTNGLFEVMYIDTLNALWNEWELISHSQAITLATRYYEDLLEDAAKIKSC